MQKIDAEVVEQVLQKLRTKPPRRRLSPYEVIAQASESISGALERGTDLDQIMSVLRDAGVELSPKTVRNYLWRARKQRSASITDDVTEERASSETQSEPAATPQECTVGETTCPAALPAHSTSASNQHCLRAATCSGAK